MKSFRSNRYILIAALLTGYSCGQIKGAFYMGGGIMPQATSLNWVIESNHTPSGAPYMISEPKPWNFGIAFGLTNRYFLADRIALGADLMYSTQVQEGDFTYYGGGISIPGPTSRGEYRIALRVVKLPIHLTTLMGKGPVFFTSSFGLSPNLIVGSRETYKAYNFYAYPPYEEGEEMNGNVYKLAGSKLNLGLFGGLGADIWVSEKLSIMTQLRGDFTLIDIITYSPFLGKIKGYNGMGILVGVYYGGR